MLTTEGVYSLEPRPAFSHSWFIYLLPPETWLRVSLSMSEALKQMTPAYETAT